MWYHGLMVKLSHFKSPNWDNVVGWCLVYLLTVVVLGAVSASFAGGFER